MASKLKVLVVSAEVSPLAKVGGLADVAGSLPKALAASGVDARIVMPGYRMVLENSSHPAEDANLAWDVPGAGGVTRTAHMWKTSLDGVDAWLVGCDEYFGGATESRKVYQAGADAYIFFCRAVLEWLERCSPKWKPDIIHVNDWHTSLVPVYLRTFPESYPRLKDTAVVCTIHNLAYQGEFDEDIVPHAGLPWDVYNYEKLECFSRANFLKGGLVFSDLVNTVSKRYAQEIQTPEYGCRLDGLLRYADANHRLWGILNGIDYTEFDPSTDGRIAAKFSADNLAGRARNRSRLQRTCGLKASKTAPICGFVGRLVDQKGIDLIKEAMPRLLEDGAQFVILGSGDPAYERWFTKLASDHPKQVYVKVGFDAAFAQQIYAGCDFFLMPSRFEPCGLGQMIALRYGAIPVVRATGGLADTIHESDSRRKTGNGFVFQDYSATALIDAMERGFELWRDQTAWSKLVAHVMREDWSWSRSAKDYVRFYKEAIKVHEGRPASAPA